MLTMNEKDKNEMLEAILNENEAYQCKFCLLYTSPLILDGGDCQVGVESTVITLAGDTPVLLRPGYITKEQMEQVLGEEVVLSGAILAKLKEEMCIRDSLRCARQGPPDWGRSR